MPSVPSHSKSDATTTQPASINGCISERLGKGSCRDGAHWSARPGVPFVTERTGRDFFALRSGANTRPLTSIGSPKIDSDS